MPTDGLGDRLQETVNGITTTFTMDLASSLTQVLDDGTNTYLYGNGRISQTNSSDTEYFLGDALGSVRQLTDASGAVTLAKNYDPFGDTDSSLGTATTPYGFTGEQQDSYIIRIGNTMFGKIGGVIEKKCNERGAVFVTKDWAFLSGHCQRDFFYFSSQVFFTGV